MRRILFLNQSDEVNAFGRSYSAFCSAYCLARLYNTVVYLSDRRQDFISSFLEGPRYSFQDIWDENPKEIARLPQTLKPGVLGDLGSPGASQRILQSLDENGGRPDTIWVSGDGDWGAMAYQAAEYYNAPLVHSDDSSIIPCVNEIQINLLPLNNNQYSRIITAVDRVTDTTISILSRIADMIDASPSIYIVGKYCGEKAEQWSALPVQITSHISDAGRIRAIANSRMYVHLSLYSRIQYMAEAAMAGIPTLMIDPASDGDLRYCGGIKIDINRCFTDYRYWQNLSGKMRTIGQNYSFVNRMLNVGMRNEEAIKQHAMDAQFQQR